MGAHSENSRRIVKNTLMLYVRMLVLMLIGFYTSRVVLGALGESDYGVYNVIGGVVAMFTVIS
ncbi:MAG: lipopolysaccharide biosynthesis protein, partial [Bacteroidales bacterium]|nr:lipopolysaccharide biosynthesis protein [Bacteroidales bacterium]